MKKQDFRRALRQRLATVPLATRQTWDGTQLLHWWLKAKDSYLRLDGVVGDDWQEVHGMCMDMCGPQAMS